MKPVTEADVLAAVRAWIERQGGVASAAATLGVDHAYVSRVAAGKQSPSQRLLAVVGLMRVRTIVRAIVPRG